jgi:uncharacterized protein involved in exopolysaccharide biosynthesis
MEYKEYPEDIDLQKYWLILKRHWLPGAVVWGTIVAVATSIALSQKPTYEASGKLRFKKQNTTSALVTQTGEKIGQLDALNSKDTPLDTEAEVLKSSPIVNQTIADLKLKNAKGEPLTYDSFLKKLKVGTVRGTDVLGITYKSTDREEAVNVVNKLIEIYIKTTFFLTALRLLLLANLSMTSYQKLKKLFIKLMQNYVSLSNEIISPTLRRKLKRL